MIQYEIKMIKVRTMDSREAAPAADLLGFVRLLTGPSGKINKKLTVLISCKMSKTLVRILHTYTHLTTKTLFFSCRLLQLRHINQNLSTSFPLCRQMFKGFDKAKDIQYVYTPVFSSLCGVKLDSNNKAGYLLSGTTHKLSVLTMHVQKAKTAGQQNVALHSVGTCVVSNRNALQ